MEKTEVQKLEESKKTLRVAAGLITIVCAYILGYAGYCASIEEIDFFAAMADALARSGQGKIFYPPTIMGLKWALFGPVIGVLSYFGLSADFLKNLSAKRGTECGTARFMTDKELAQYNQKYITPDPPVIIPTKESPIITYSPEKDTHMYPQNFIMSQRFRRPCDLRGCDLRGNNNVLIVGGAGTGKSRFVMKPNLLQMNCSYVITDPSGEMVESVGSVLRDHGYKIKIFNISDMGHSNCYNPLKYIRDEAGVDMLIECLINNTTRGEGGGDNQFFVDAEKLLYSACIFYLKDFCNDVSQKSFATVMKMINASRVDENNSYAKSDLDKLFDSIPPNSLAATRYRAFKQAAGKTLKSIIISCVVRLRPFMTPQVINLTSSDSLDLGRVGYEKTALFIITPQADRTYAFLASMLYSQMFETLYYEGEKRKASGKSEELPVPVRCMMDEFANIGEVPEFPSKLYTMRKYNISATIVLQDLAQIEAMYQDNWRTLVGNCSTYIFLGTQESNTLKYFSELLGKQTIRTKSENRSYGTRGSTSRGYQPTGRLLLEADELGRIPPDECIVFTQSMWPVHDKKYDYTGHPYYKWTSDADKKYSYLYKQMQVYNNTQQSRLTSLLRALSEMERYRTANTTNTVSEPDAYAVRPKFQHLQDVKFEEGKEHKVTFDDETEKRIYKYCFDKCMIAGIDNVEEEFCIIRVTDIEIKYMNRLARELSAQMGGLGVSKLLLFVDDKNGILRCVAYGRTEKDKEQLRKAMRNKFARAVNYRPDDPCIVTAISENAFEDYVKTIKKKEPNNVPLHKDDD